MGRDLTMLTASELRARVDAVGPDSPIYTLRDLFTRGGSKGGTHESKREDEVVSSCPVDTTRGDQWAGKPCGKVSLNYLVKTFRFIFV